jgi:putative acetyltransferase
MPRRRMNIAPAVRIEPFEPPDAGPFAALNRAWLIGHDLIEPADEAQLRDPDTHVFARGGEIFMARVAGVAVGCCAAIPHGAATIEVAKLAVDPSARGHGIGRKLVHAALRFGQERGCRTAMLTSSTRLTAALRLYESLGFAYRPVPADVPYKTVDVYMELDLTGWVIPRAARRPGRRASHRQAGSSSPRPAR